MKQVNPAAANIQGLSEMRYEKLESQSRMMYHESGTAMTNDSSNGEQKMRHNSSYFFLFTDAKLRQ